MQSTPKSSSHIYPIPYTLYSQQNNPNDQIQINTHDTIQQKCQKLLQINTNLTYNISLLELELEAVKRMQKEKNEENNKQKDKIKVRVEKENQMKRRLQAQAMRIKKMLAGMKSLQQEKQEMLRKQEVAREKRINGQDRKNQKYEEFDGLEKEYRDLIIQIKQRDGVIDAIQQAYEVNENLKNQIQQIQSCLNEEKSYRDNAQSIKKERNNKVRELNERVITLQKQQDHLRTEISKIEQNKIQWQNERQKIQQKSGEAVRLYQRIQQLKSTLAAKRTQYAEIDSTYKQLSIEENKIKKEIVLKNECEEERRKYREGLKRQQLQKQRHGNVEYDEIQDNNEERKDSKQSHRKEQENNAESRLNKWVKRYEDIRRKNG